MVDKLRGACLCVRMMSRTYRSSVRSYTDKIPCDTDITLKWTLNIYKGEYVDWIHVADDRDR
jgi:hypothetical protein